jgi:hypothetical protein
MMLPHSDELSEFTATSSCSVMFVSDAHTPNIGHIFFAVVEG